MAKIGRNEKCPCQSGKKYKHCCARLEQNHRPQPTPEQDIKATLMTQVERIQADAAKMKTVIMELGVFFFFSTAKGDAWLMEMTDCDCVQVASSGEALKAPIDENSEIIEVDWSHRYAIRNKQLELTAYEDDSVSILKGAPSKDLGASMRRLYNKFSKEELGKVHVSEPEASMEE